MRVLNSLLPGGWGIRPSKNCPEVLPGGDSFSQVYSAYMGRITILVTKTNDYRG